MNLSLRMQAVSALVREVDCLADVGCDHGYVSIDLVKRNVAKHVIAMDVRPGPLSCARENICEEGLSEKIETRLSDGLEGLAPGEVQAVVIAGMGGDLMLRILKEHPEVLEACDQLVLQPQSEVARVREEIFSLGFAIDAEDMVLDDGKHYMMFSCRNLTTCVEPSDNDAFTRAAWENPTEYRYGRFLLIEHNPVIKAFLEREYQKFEDILSALHAKGGHEERIIELEREQAYRREALSYYEM